MKLKHNRKIAKQGNTSNRVKTSGNEAIENRSLITKSPKSLPAQKSRPTEETKKEESVKANIPPKSSKLLMVSSFAAMGFLFSFLTGYGYFDLIKGIEYGILGALGGFAVGYIPYVLKT